MSFHAAVASLKRVWWVTQILMRGNRLLLALLVLWPCALSLILFAVEGGHPAVQDLRAAETQEWFYGVVLVGFASSLALGTEVRAHRVQAVMSRAVGRTEYLAALGGSAFLPFLGYVLMLLLTVSAAAAVLDVQAPALLATAAAELVAGVLAGSLGLLLSVCLPQIAAAIGSGIAVGGLFGLRRAGLFDSIADAFGVVAGQHGWQARSGLHACLSMVVAAALFCLAAWRFQRRDLLL